MSIAITPLSDIQVRNAKRYKLFNGGGLYIEVLPLRRNFGG